MKLKQLIFALLIVSMGVKSYGQRISNIRFIHRGEELKPIGTLSISTDEVIVPTDRQLDKIYGKAVKTDTNSFNLVADFVINSKLLTNKPRKLHGNKEFYEIIIVSVTNTQRLYLGEHDIIAFFNTLRDLLIKDNADPHLLDALKYY